MAIIDLKNSPQDEKDKKISLLLDDLASLESYIHDILTFSPLSLCFINPLGIVLEANPAFEKISNFDSNEIVGEPIEKIFDKEKIEKLVKETLKKEFVDAQEMVLLSKDEKEISVSVFTRTRKDEKEKVVGFFLSIFDLTDVKKIQHRLEEAMGVLEVKVKARTRELEEEREILEEKVKKRTKELEGSKQTLITTLSGVEGSRKALVNMLEDVEAERDRAEEERDKTEAVISDLADGLLVFNETNTLSLINPRAEEYLGVKAGEVVGKTVSKLKNIPIFESLVKLFGKEIKRIFRQEIQAKKGLTLEATTVYMVRGKERKGTLVVLHDITREKIVERTKSEFVSIAAHQLRTPLSAIKWTLRMFLSGDLGEVTEEQREFVKKSYQSNERMIGLINDLLNVSRIEEGRYLYKPESIDIEDLVRSIIKSYERLIEKKKLKFKFEKPKKKLPKITVDVEKMKLAVENLIDNSVKYTYPRGEVTVVLEYVNMGIEFSIKDTGVGIPEDQQNRVFSKFFRGANVIRMETEGNGLGLFITKNIIDAHGGRIWFESKEGKGSTFRFVLPIKKEFDGVLEKPKKITKKE